MSLPKTMLDFFNSFRQKINIKYFMAAYVGGLLILSSFAFKKPENLWKGFLIVALYFSFDLLWTYVRDKKLYLPVSSLISGFILSIVAVPNPDLWLLIALPLFAVASKQLIWLGKNRHIFNPASFSMFLLAFFVPSVSWWGVARGGLVLWIVIFVGIFILWKQKRWHVTIPFLFSYAFFLTLLFVWGGISFSQVPRSLYFQIVDGTTLFFATVMLIEPISSQFAQKRDRFRYGVWVGFFAVLTTYAAQVLVVYFPQALFLTNQDPLILGLFFGNLLGGLMFLENRKKPIPETAQASEQNFGRANPVRKS